MDVEPRKLALIFQNTITSEESALLHLTLEGLRRAGSTVNSGGLQGFMLGLQGFSEQVLGDS